MYLTKQKRVRYIEIFKKAMDSYYLFIPTAILNESVGFPEFKNKSKEMYKDILELKEKIKELENVTGRKK